MTEKDKQCYDTEIDTSKEENNKREKNKQIKDPTAPKRSLSFSSDFSMMSVAS